jgi:3-oxoacyl-[acyl-carrier-protein] synthase III
LQTHSETQPLYLHSLGHFHPETVIDNRFLERLDIGTTDEWILARTGIRSRHTVLSLEYICATRNRDPRAADEASRYSNAETACRAAGMAIHRAGLVPAEIGMVIAGTSAPRMGSPAEACLISDLLGISPPSLDINSACSSFTAQLLVISMMAPESMPDFILLVQPENLTRAVDYTDRNTAVLMGDGTTAAIVSRRVPSAVMIGPVTMESDPGSWRKVAIPCMGHLDQDGSAVQNFAIRKMTGLIGQLREHARENFWFVGHQANLPMLQSVCARAGVDPAMHLFNVDRRGNCGAAGSASVISEYFPRFHSGDQIAVTVVGAGLTWGGFLIEFGGEDNGNAIGLA